MCDIWSSRLHSISIQLIYSCVVQYLLVLIILWYCPLPFTDREFFTAKLTLSESTAEMGIMVGTIDTANISILDDDTVTCYYERGNYSVAESAETLDVTVVCDGEFAVPFDVEIPFVPMSAKG